MNSDRELMQMALDALESKYIVNCGAWQVERNNAAKALRDRLAQPEPEPVAWFIQYEYRHEFLWREPTPHERNSALEIKPLYAAPVHAIDISQECVDETAKDRHESVEYLTPVSWYGDQPLYAKPTCTAPLKREWVRLTDEEVHDAFNFVEFVKQVSFDRDRPEWCENFAAYLETKLKEKNT